MRQFTQIGFPPWVRTYSKSTSVEFFDPARTKIAVKLLTYAHLAFDFTSLGNLPSNAAADATAANEPRLHRPPPPPRTARHYSLLCWEYILPEVATYMNNK